MNPSTLPTPESIGQKILEEISKQAMVTIDGGPEDPPVIMVWNGNTEEQLESIVHHFYPLKEEIITMNGPIMTDLNPSTVFHTLKNFLDTKEEKEVGIVSIEPCDGTPLPPTQSQYLVKYKVLP